MTIEMVAYMCNVFEMNKTKIRKLCVFVQPISKPKLQWS